MLTMGPILTVWPPGAGCVSWQLSAVILFPVIYKLLCQLSEIVSHLSGNGNEITGLSAINSGLPGWVEPVLTDQKTPGVIYPTPIQNAIHRIKTDQ
jgi:hypothetical protein